MAIVGDTPEDAVEQFVDHINGVLSQTITDRRVKPLGVPGKGLTQVSFPRRNGPPTAAVLATRFGPMRFLFWQTLTTDAVDGGYQLRTRNYAYKLTMTNDRQPFIRWEYVKPKSRGDRKCRHHLQGPMELATGRTKTPLNNVHLPTGWVTFEEVIRFCVMDLKVPKRSTNWNAVLLDSYRRFKEEFAPLGQA